MLHNFFFQTANVLHNNGVVTFRFCDYLVRDDISYEMKHRKCLLQIKTDSTIVASFDMRLNCSLKISVLHFIWKVKRL